jgi:sugar lactone lactonase YvrE
MHILFTTNLRMLYISRFAIASNNPMKTHISIVLVVAAHALTAFAHPSSGIVVDEQGSVYFSDLSRGILKVDGQGKVTTISEEGGHWLALDTKGSFANAEFEKSGHWPRWFKRRTTAGARPALITDGGSPLVVAPDGNLYYVCNDEQMIPGGLQIARLTPDGRETLLNPDWRRKSDELGGIKGLAAGPKGSLYITYPRALMKVALNGMVTPLLNPVVVPDCDTYPSSSQDAPFLRGLAVDASGVAYVAATGCRCVIRIAPKGKVTTVLKAEAPWAPCGVALHGEDIYVLEHINPISETHEGWPPRVRKVAGNGGVSTLVTFSPESETSQRK